MRFDWRIVLCAFWISGCAVSSEWTVLEKGLLEEKLHSDFFLNHDVSAVTVVDNRLYFATDGGAQADKPRLVSVDSFTKSAGAIQFHEFPSGTIDIEGGTTFNKQPAFLSSLSGQKHSDCHLIIFESNGEQRCHALRNAIVKQLQNQFESAWAAKVLGLAPKQGGINAEGLAAKGGRLYIGLRSPLWHPAFGKTKQSLHKGDAIVIETSVFQGSSILRATAIDLGGMGIRGMEFVSSISAFIIIAGTVDKTNSYSLWQVSEDLQTRKQIRLPEFDGLCRPESVFPLQGALLIVSERSGKACEGSQIDYLILARH